MFIQYDSTLINLDNISTISADIINEVGERTSDSITYIPKQRLRIYLKNKELITCYGISGLKVIEVFEEICEAIKQNKSFYKIPSKQEEETQNG